MRPLRILTLAFLLFTLTAAAQTDRRIEEQKRVIAALEKRIATEEQEISKIQKGRTAWRARLIRATSCSTRPKSRRASCAERSPARTAWPGTFRQSSNATARSTAKWCAKPTATTSTTTT